MFNNQKEKTLRSISQLRTQQDSKPTELVMHSVYTDISAEDLCFLLSNNSSITSIKIKASDNINVEFEKIMEPLRANQWFISHLTYLHISSYNLSVTYEAFLSEISFLINLESLCISSNALPKESGDPIAECVFKLKHLKKLDVSFNPIWETAATKIVSNVSLDTIEDIDLSATCIKDSGFLNIMQLLSQANNLQAIRLPENQISDCEGLEPGLFKYHTNLRVFDIGLNPITPKGASTFLSAIKENRSILLLKINNSSTLKQSTPFINSWVIDRDNIIACYHEYLTTEGVNNSLTEKHMLYKSLATSLIDAHDKKDQYASIDLFKLIIIFRYQAAIQHAIYHNVSYFGILKPYKHCKRQDVCESFKGDMYHLWCTNWISLRGLAKTCEILPRDILYTIGSFLHYHDIKQEIRQKLEIGETQDYSQVTSL